MCCGDFCRCISLILWWVCGGLILGLVWLLLGLICIISIIGCVTGWYHQCFKIAMFCLWPTGEVRRAVDSPCECGCDCICNIVWIVLIGWEMWLVHMFCWIIFCIFGLCGIELGKYHWELAWCALMPYGAVFTRDGKIL